MKNKGPRLQMIFAILVATMLSSCTPTYFYQVYKVTPPDMIKNENEYLFYEDDNCMVLYNLWDIGGNIGFQFHNKTDNNIYLNMEESFFVLNGIAYNYYKSRIYTTSSSSATSTSQTAIRSRSVTGINYLDLIETYRLQASYNVRMLTASGFSVSYNEAKIVNIPAGTSKIITEYKINESLYRDCDLFKYPRKKQVKSKKFSIEESPIVFTNIISYTIGQSEDIIKLANKFYVSEISNYPESDMLDSRYDKFCGQKSAYRSNYFNKYGPDRFYIKYTKGADTWKH